MWHNKKVSVIFPTYREKKSIKSAILAFSRTGYVDEIIVIDNNAEKGTATEVAKTHAKLVYEKKQGYGAAIRKGIRFTKANLLIVAEPDGTFDGGDVLKLLAYSDDFDMVFGSRTYQPLIHSGSAMHFARRISDVLYGKIISLLYLSPPVTDVGCTLRLTTKEAWAKIAKHCTSDSALFATEWILEAAKNKIRFIQIPVNFKPRIGHSTYTGTLAKQIFWGLVIFLLIFKKRFFR